MKKFFLSTMMFASMQFLSASENNYNDSTQHDNVAQLVYPKIEDLIDDYSECFDKFIGRLASSYHPTRFKENDSCPVTNHVFKLDFQVGVSKWIRCEYSQEKKRFSIVAIDKNTYVQGIYRQEGFHLTNPELGTLIDQITGEYETLGKASAALKTDILPSESLKGLYISFDQCVGMLFRGCQEWYQYCAVITMKDVNTPDELSMALIEILTNLEKNFVNKFNQNPDNSKKQLKISKKKSKELIEISIKLKKLLKIKKTLIIK